MAQGPLPVRPINTGLRSALGIAAAAVVKSGAGILARITVQVPPTAGNLVVNDLAAATGSAAANIITSIPFGSLAAGQVITLEWPVTAGIAVTSVGTGGVFSVSYT